MTMEKKTKSSGKKGRVLARVLADDLDKVTGGLIVPISGGGETRTAQSTVDPHGHPDFTNNKADGD